MQSIHTLYSLLILSTLVGMVWLGNKLDQ